MLKALTYVSPTLICVIRFVHYVVEVLFKACVLSPFPDCLGHWKSTVVGPGDVKDALGRVHPLWLPDRPHRTRRWPRKLRQSPFFTRSLTAHFWIQSPPDMVTIKFKSELPRFKEVWIKSCLFPCSWLPKKPSSEGLFALTGCPWFKRAVLLSFAEPIEEASAEKAFLWRGPSG